MSHLLWWRRHYELGARFFWAFGLDRQPLTTTLWLGIFHIWWVNGAFDGFDRKRLIYPRDKWPYIAPNLD